MGTWAEGHLFLEPKLQQHLQQHVEHYAQRLEYYLRQAPLNWFNFYSFWSDESTKH